MRRAACVLLLALATVAGLTTPAAAQRAGSTEADPDVLTVPSAADTPPPGRRGTARAMIARARRTEAVRRALREHPAATARAYLRGEDRWQVSYYARTRASAREEVAQVQLSDRTGRVLEAWSGIQVAWTMARGYPGAFGRSVNALYVWIPLCVLFVLPFLRGPLRLLHLDLAVLLSFSVSYAFFGAAEIGASVPLAYPPLVYLLVRMLLLARARARDGGLAALPPIPLRLGADLLGVGIVFLLGFRLGLNVTNGNVIDVGYAGVVGADRLLAGDELYGNFPRDNLHGDTYGPIAYLLYVPFELLFPWSGTWDDLPAAHAAAVAFDVLCALILWLLGRRLRGPLLGLLLAYLWLAFPFSLLVANSNSNDALVPLFVLAALLAAERPLIRGALLALGAMAKFSPLGLAPLFAMHPGDPPDSRSPLRTAALTTAAVAAIIAASLGLIVALEGGLKDFWERSIAFQADRESPFSLWGLYELPSLQRAVQLATVALAVAVAFVPRRRDAVSLAALAAAVTIAVQLGMGHWFYLYIVWFAPLVLVALLGRHAEVSGTSSGSIDVAERPPSLRTTTPMSQGSSSELS